jgi:hypothetical protein
MLSGLTRRLQIAGSVKVLDAAQAKQLQLINCIIITRALSAASISCPFSVTFSAQIWQTLALNGTSRLSHSCIERSTIRARDRM